MTNSAIQYESHKVMEQMLGRPLEAGNVVHHNHLPREDNSPENLRLFDSILEHNAYHNWLRNGCIGSEAAAIKKATKKRIRRETRQQKLEDLSFSEWQKKIAAAGGINNILVDKIFKGVK